MWGGAVIMEGLALKLCRWPRRAWKVPAVRLVLWGARPESQGLCQGPLAMSTATSPQLSWPSRPLALTSASQAFTELFPDPPSPSLKPAGVHPPYVAPPRSLEGAPHGQVLVCVRFGPLKSSQNLAQSKDQGCFWSKKMSRTPAPAASVRCPCPGPSASEGLSWPFRCCWWDSLGGTS